MKWFEGLFISLREFILLLSRPFISQRRGKNTKMENRFNDSITRAKRGQILGILTPALALSLGFGLFASSSSMAFGQQAPEGSTVSSQQAALEKKVSETVTPQAPLASPADLSRVFINVAKRVKPAVVQINIVSAGLQPTT